MDIEKLIEQLNSRGLSNGSSLGYHCGLCVDAATALSTLQAENEKLRAGLKKAEMKIDSFLDEEEKVAFYPFGAEKEDYHDNH